MKTSKQLLEARAKDINDARGIMDKAKTEDREPTAEETQSFDKLMKSAAEMKTQADQIVANAKRMSDLEAEELSLEGSQGRLGSLEQANNSLESKSKKSGVFKLKDSVCGDTRNISLTGNRSSVEHKAAFRSYLLQGSQGVGVQAALQKDIDTAGGYLSATEQFMAELIRKVDDLVFMRSLGRVLAPLMTADSLGIPSLDNDPADPTWTSELSTGDEDTDMNFGKRELKPHPVAQRIKVSKTLLRRSSIGPESIVMDRLAYKMGIVLENGYLNGDGANQPLGVFTASANGITTGRDVSTGNTATEIRFDGLKEAEYSLKAQYRRVASWLFHRDAIKQISKLKDGEGRYIWQPSVQVGQPDRLLNLPISESEYAPNTFTTGLYVGMLADFSKYWMVDALTLTIQVLMELYAATNQTGYISRAESDGMPVLEEAFARVTLG